MENLIAQLSRLLLPAQAYHLQKPDGSYPPAKGETLTERELRLHLQGEATAALNLVSQDGLARCAVVDLDGGPSHWRYVRALLEAATELELPRPLVSVSGSKGYGVWFVFEGPLPVGQVQAFLRYIRKVYFGELAKSEHDLRPDTDRPTIAGEAVIKLPPCLHRKSGKWSAWVEPGAYVDAPPTGLDAPPDMDAQAELLRATPSIGAGAFTRALDRLSKRVGASQGTGEGKDGPRYQPELGRISEGSHAPCIAALVESGAPHPIDYNTINLNLAAYSKARGLNAQEAEELARKVAEVSEEHPTSKKTVGAKLKNYRSNANPGPFYCDYPRNTRPWSEAFGGWATCRGCAANPGLPDNRQDQAERPFDNGPSRNQYGRLEEPVALDLLAWAWASGEKLPEFGKALPAVELVADKARVWFSPAALAARVHTSADYFREVDFWKPERRFPENQIPEIRHQAQTQAAAFLEKLRATEPNEAAGKAALERARQLEQRAAFHERLREAANKGPEVDTGIVAAEVAKVATETLRQKKSGGPLVGLRSELFAGLARTEAPTVETPLPRLNTLLHGGWRGGRLYVLVAPPKAGKTTFVAVALDHAAAQGNPCLYVGYEMARGQLVDYALARKLGINSRRIETRHLSEEEAEEVAWGLDSYLQTVGSNLEIWEAGLLTGIADVRGWVERQRAEHPEKTPLVVIDYLQLAQTGIPEIDRHPSETKRVSALAVACKDLARQTGAAVVALSSVTKEAERASTAEGEIDVTAARDSLAIIHAADGVLTLQTKTVRTKRGEEETLLDPWEFIAERAQQRGETHRAQEFQRGLNRVADKYPSGGKGVAIRARLSLIRHRGSTGDVPIYYRKAFHQMEEAQIPGLHSLDSFRDGDTYNPERAGDVFRKYIDTSFGNTDGATVAETTARHTGELFPDKPEEEPTGETPEVAYRIVTDTNEAKAALSELVESGEPVGLDLETTGLDPLVASPRLLQVAHGNGPVLIVDLYETGGLQALREPLEKLHAVAHNAAFDMGFLRRAGVKLTPDCTMLAAHVLKGRMVSLAELAEEELGWTLDKGEQTSDWSGELTETQLRYAALDAEAVRQLYPQLQAELEERGSTKAYRLTRDAQPAVVDMELAGMPFDVDAQTAMVEELTTKRDKLRAELETDLGGRNPNSGPQLGEWLTEALGGEESESYKAWPKTGSGRLATGADDLTKGLRFLPVEAQRTVKERLLPYKETEKLISTYGASLAKHIHEATGRIHASLNLAGAVTGRMSSAKPNLQNMPRDKTFRGLFRAPEGRAFAIADYNAMELRVAAMLAEESNLLGAFEAGDDPHILSASMILGKKPEEVTAQERQLAKAVNFGLLYGQAARGLRDYAASSYGVEISEAKAREYRGAWFKAYPAFVAWHRKTAAESSRAKAVRTPAGRERRFTEKDYRDTKAYNTPVQGGAAEAILAALGHLNTKLSASNLNAKPVAVVHDEIVVEADSEHAQAVAKLLEESMVAGMLDVFPKAATKGLVEASVGGTWAEKA